MNSRVRDAKHFQVSKTRDNCTGQSAGDSWEVYIRTMAPRSNSSSDLDYVWSVVITLRWCLELNRPQTGSLIQRHYDWETYVSPSKPPLDSGLVAVFDACKAYSFYDFDKV